MATKTPTTGMAHLTVVPENLDEAAAGDEPAERGEAVERGEAAAGRSAGENAE
ncbi:hypothetical protein [Halosimplex marinum]|uniref:hypothetical protein n=1 Tax=Halosimplex marinum TaxID=3396620 RepID=UPI003F55A64F